MTFVSYAQNFEDLLLWRSLKDVDTGFYIDVGACDPTEHSVTRAFYERGWRGINIDPDKRIFARLESQRPLDINLELAVGNKGGDIDFYETGTIGLATTVKAVAARHNKTKKNPVSYSVPLSPLSDICEKFVKGPIHFLKIDVEGGERAALEGADFGKWRPWIVVVEATVPMSDRPNHQEWEALITTAGYKFVYFDGLNRYYVADEHSDLAKSFSVPPNVFDDFLIHRMTTEGIKLANHGALNPDDSNKYNRLLWDYARDTAPSELNIFRAAAARADASEARIAAADKRIADIEALAEARAAGAEQRAVAAAARADAADAKVAEADKRVVEMEVSAQAHMAGAEQRVTAAAARADAAEARIAEADRRAADMAVSAEARAVGAEKRAIAAAARADAAEARAVGAEQRARAAAARSVAATEEAHDANRRAEMAEHRSQAAELRVSTALERAKVADCRVQIAESFADTAEHRAIAAEMRSVAAEQRSAAAEQRLVPAVERALGESEKSTLLEQQLKAVYESTSWRLTRPIRMISRLIRGR